MAGLKMRADLSRHEQTTNWPYRRISRDDAQALGLLMYASYKGTVDYEGESVEEAVTEMQGTLDGKYGAVLEEYSYLVEQEGQAICASIVTRFDPVNAPLLSFLMTHPEHKGKGVGAFLLREGMNALLDGGYSELYLFVNPRNEPALHLYRKLGFVEIE